MAKISEKFAEVTKRVQGQVSTLAIIQTVIAIQHSLIVDLISFLDDPDTVAAVTQDRLAATAAAVAALCDCATDEVANLSALELLAKIDAAYTEHNLGADAGRTVH